MYLWIRMLSCLLIVGNLFGQLDQLAYQKADAFYRGMYKKCGQYYYYKYVQEKVFLYQCKYAPSVWVDGKTFERKRLSEADRLNGVDPLPIAWEGWAHISFNVCRSQVYYRSEEPGAEAWGRWEDKFSDSVRFWDRKGVWSFHNDPIGTELYVKDVIVPVRCDEMPGLAKKWSVPQPSWEEGEPNEWRQVTIPAAFDGWLYLGTGPIQIKPVNPYSTVYIDGGARHSTIYSRGYESTTWPRRTNPKAWSSDAELGAVVVKYGANGDAFPAFIDMPGRTMSTVEAPEGSRVFVAINDSYFPDNRGQHLILVRGQNLCIGCEPPKRPAKVTFTVN